MGIAWGDYNNDGWLDFYTTGGEDGQGSLYQNSKGKFVEVTRKAKISPVVNGRYRSERIYFCNGQNLHPDQQYLRGDKVAPKIQKVSVLKKKKTGNFFIVPEIEENTKLVGYSILVISGEQRLIDWVFFNDSNRVFIPSRLLVGRDQITINIGAKDLAGNWSWRRSVISGIRRCQPSSFGVFEFSCF